MSQKRNLKALGARGGGAQVAEIGYELFFAMQKSVEVLAPAGDETTLFAALRAGADAVYFGLDVGFNARIRATNITLARLNELMQRIHEYGRRGYVTLNTLVFDHELEPLEDLLGRLASAGVDAVIVQDLGVARWVSQLCPTMRLHASTQMTCTNERAVEVAASLGASRVTLARELSLSDIRLLSGHSSIELEVFAHGALCVSYSGQCLTSEAIGGRSANRGACAQACRLPYDLIVDGIKHDLGDLTYLLSPQDLDASERVPELIASGVTALKIEGRLKSAEYVTAATLLYRRAVDAALGRCERPGKFEREAVTQAFSRGTSIGFLDGTNHQSLIAATSCDHVGVALGTCDAVTPRLGKNWLCIDLDETIARGDGILVSGTHDDSREFGGRIWAISVNGMDVEQASSGATAWVWLGPDKSIPEGLIGRRVFRTSAPRVSHALEVEVSRSSRKVAVTATLRGNVGGAPELELRAEDGRHAVVVLDGIVEQARKRPLDEATAFDKLSRLGDTPFELVTLSMELASDVTLPLSSLNRGRRDAVAALLTAAERRHSVVAGANLAAQLKYPTGVQPSPGLFVTCRNPEQAEAAILAGADGLYLDFLALKGVGAQVRALRDKFSGAVSIGLALPRIAKPKEEEIETFLRGLKPSAVLIRSLGSLRNIDSLRASERDSASGVTDGAIESLANETTIVADFSLNASNSLTAIELLSRGVSAFTPSYDLDAGQLHALLDSPLAAYAEVVIHHPMPLFHMEHCVIAARLSKGQDYRECGRPCERHQISLRDRTGMLLPLEADVGCRNTVFHGKSQSAVDELPVLTRCGVRRFRVELLREGAKETDVLVRSYRAALTGEIEPVQLRRQLSLVGLSAVRGSLRVVG